MGDTEFARELSGTAPALHEGDCVALELLVILPSFGFNWRLLMLCGCVHAVGVVYPTFRVCINEGGSTWAA